MTNNYTTDYLSLGFYKIAIFRRKHFLVFNPIKGERILSSGLDMLMQKLRVTEIR